MSKPKTLAESGYTSAIIGISIFILLLNTVSAWNPNTHQAIADVICDDFNCDCRDAILDGAVNTDTKEGAHYCYEVGFNCPAGTWICPARNDCPAKSKFIQWLRKAKDDAGCARWFDMGVASHYFLDAEEFWSKVTREDPVGCREAFENETDAKIAGGLSAEWRVCKCGACTSNKDFERYVRDFEDKIGLSVQKENPKIILVANSIDYSADLGILLVNKGFNVDYVKPKEFNATHKKEKRILILGGQNAPEGAGEITKTLLIPAEQSLLLASNTSKSVFTKNNVWRENQVVKIAAGYEKEQTRRAWIESKDALF